MQRGGAAGTAGGGGITNGADREDDQRLLVLRILEQRREVNGVVRAPELVLLKRQVGERCGPAQFGRGAGQQVQLVENVALQKWVFEAVQVEFCFTSEADAVAHP